jgi:hypothetical protein
VLGNDLSGTGDFPGDYELDGSGLAFSPAIDAGGVTDVELIVKRKLGVAAGDHALIVYKNVLTQSVWSNSEQAIDDDDWVEGRYPLPQADNVSGFQIAFQLASNGGGPSYGWNLDELIVKDSKEPDYHVCGGCQGAPSFGGLASAVDPDPCGPSGLLLEWQPAVSWGSGSDGTYDVYRSTSPDFVPDDGNRVASGLTGTSWTDGNAPANTDVWYIVRARNDEDCGGEGLADANEVRRSARETVSLPPPDGVGASLRAVNVGSAHVQLTWDPVPGADRYVVRRSSEADFGSPEEIGETSETLFEDVGASGDGADYFYRVFAANACGEEAP